jgi:serine/threonine protein kinase
VTTRVGTNLDRYEIDAELGRGAMGVVYRARDPKLDRTVAIKTVSLTGLDSDAQQEYRKRFVVEAQAAGRLSHPGIVTIFDVREEEAEPYLVMEYVEGQSLQQLLSRENRTLPLSTTLRLIQLLAEALHYAHTQGVVHRDIKPANILVTVDGQPKIADFGIAKLNQTELTLPGQVLGSPAFMAPEQLSDESSDSRSDLFSLGVILYYMLTGHRPFQGNSTTTVCFKLVNHEPLPVSAFESKFPPELDKIVARAMAKDPAQRYQSGMAMASDMQALRENSEFVAQNLEGTSRERTATRSRAAVQKTKAAQLQKRIPKAIVAGSLLAVAIAGVIFRNVHKANLTNDPAQTIAIDTVPTSATPPPVERTTAVGNRGQGEVTANKQLKTAPRRSRSVIVQTKSAVGNTKSPTRSRLANAVLQIQIDHHFTDALASIWVDNGLVYTQSLHADTRKRALLFRTVKGREVEAVRVVPGKHEVRVRIQSAADSYDRSSIITDASIDNNSLLRIVCDNKNKGLQVTLQK